MNKLLIVDGLNLHFQMFFGMPSRIVNKAGKSIQGTLGFVGALIKIMKMTNPTHVVVLFDGEHAHERAALLPAYKANRLDYGALPENENPFTQLADVQDALTYMHIKHAEIEELETDDVIAGYTHTYQDECELVIASFDSDFFQLISNTVQVLRYRGKKTILCDSAYVNDKLQIPPLLYADFKSLVGDNADNIKGVKGIGPKTAAALLNQFGGLQAIIDHVDEIEKPAVRKLIAADIRRLQVSYKLIKLENRAKLPFALGELLYTYKGMTTTQVLQGIGLR